MRTSPMERGVWQLVLVALLILNAVGVGLAIIRLSGPISGFDFAVLSDAAGRVNPYDQPWYVWSPLAVYPLQLIITLGMAGWIVLHALALAPLRWPLALLVGASWPFWYDLASGNALIFVAVAGVTAYRGSRLGTVAYIVLALLMPRPLVLPLLAWLLWQRPWTRSVFAVLLSVNVIGVLASGYADDWMTRLTALPGVMENDVNLAPSRWVGWAWWPVGLVFGAWALVRGRLGLASIAVQPYLFPPYLLMLALEPLTRPDRSRSPIASGWRWPASPSSPISGTGSSWRRT